MGEPQGADLGGSGLFTEAAQPPLPADPSVLPLPGGEPPPSDPADAPPPPEAQSSPPPPVKESPPPPSPSKSPPPSSPPPSSPPPSTPAASSPPPAPPAPSDPSSKSPPSDSSPPSVTPPPPAAEATPSQPNQPPASSNSPPAPPSENPGVPAVLSPPEAGIPQSPSGRPFTGAPPISHKTPPGAAHPYSPPSNDSSSGSVLVVGVVLSGVLLLLIIGICIACSKKKKKPQYYMDHGRHPKANDPYYNGPNHWNNSPMEHVVKVQMGTPGGGGGGGWGAPPMQQGNMSGEFHSGLYNNNQQASPNMGMGGFNQSQFSYQDLAAATGSFSQANLLGQGGFGYVHKGVLPDGRVVAVKSLKSGSGQGEREFQAEVDIISRVHHRHLVSLVGYCIADGQRMLVYEFVSNSTLEFHLHGKGQPVMSWEVRLRIARGSAKGLAYLHEDCHPRIIHRDIKAANILLDDNFEAMVADFGLAKLSSGNDTHVSTRVMGTFGYLAPEYASSGKLSDKSDVFSFGVMLLELITGRKPVDPNDRYMEDSLVDWARPLMGKALEDGDYSEIADPRLEGNYVSTEMARLVACAAASIRHSARRRPKMSQIVRALEGDSSLEDLNDAAGKPKISSGSGIGTSETQMYDTKMYNADMSKFRKMIMTSGEFNSSDFGATSEYGLNPSSTSGESREYGSPGLQKPKP